MQENHAAFCRAFGISSATDVTLNLLLTIPEIYSYAAIVSGVNAIIDQDRVVLPDVGEYNSLVMIDLAGLKKRNGCVTISFPASWLPDSLQETLFDGGNMFNRMRCESEIARVIREMLETGFVTVPELHDVFAPATSDSAGMDQLQDSNGMRLSLVESTTQGSSTAATTTTITTRCLSTVKRIERGAVFMICEQARAVDVATIIGTSLGYKLCGLNKQQSLPSNFAPGSFNQQPCLLQFGVLQHNTQLIGGALAVFAADGQNPNAFCRVARTPDSNGNTSICLVAYRHIDAGEPIVISRGDWFTRDIYQLMTGSRLPTFSSATVTNAVATAAAVISAAPIVVTNQRLNELVSVASQQMVELSVAAADVNQDNDDDDDDDDKDEATMRAEESSRLQNMRFIETNLLPPSSPPMSQPAKRARFDDGSENNFIRQKMPRYNLLTGELESESSPPPPQSSSQKLSIEEAFHQLGKELAANAELGGAVPLDAEVQIDLM